MIDNGFGGVYFDRAMNLGPDPVSQIINAGRILAEQRMTAGSGGNLSVRLQNGEILITRSGVSKGRLTATDIVTVDSEGQVLKGSGMPSSEMLMHLFVYRQRPDVMACVHAHPPYATSFAVAGVPLPADVLPEVIVYVGPIATAAFAAPGTAEVPRSLEPYVKSHHAFLLANHGLLTVGRTMAEALNRHETVEQFAKILSIARQLGGVNEIPQTEVTRLTGLRPSSNG